MEGLQERGSRSLENDEDLVEALQAVRSVKKRCVFVAYGDHKQGREEKSSSNCTRVGSRTVIATK